MLGTGWGGARDAKHNNPFFPLSLSFPLCHMGREGFPCFLHRDTVRLQVTISGPEPFSQSSGIEDTQTHSLPSGGSQAVRKVHAPPATISWQEGSAGGMWPHDRAGWRTSQPVLASPSSVLEVYDWSCVGTRGVDIPTSGQASKILIYVTVQGDSHDILQRVEFTRRQS